MLRYVLLNVRHHVGGGHAKRVARVLFDRASSARWFDGWRRERIATREDAGLPKLGERPPVARARTWLLTVGWRAGEPADGRTVPPLDRHIAAQISPADAR